MVLIFIESSDAFAVNDEALEGGIGRLIVKLKRLVPHPETLGARIDCRSNPEPSVVGHLKNYAVEKE